jgi:hypothetical protein
MPKDRHRLKKVKSKGKSFVVTWQPPIRNLCWLLRIQGRLHTINAFFVINNTQMAFNTCKVGNFVISK